MYDSPHLMEYLSSDQIRLCWHLSSYQKEIQSLRLSSNLSLMPNKQTNKQKNKQTNKQTPNRRRCAPWCRPMPRPAAAWVWSLLGALMSSAVSPSFTSFCPVFTCDSWHLSFHDYFSKLLTKSLTIFLSFFKFEIFSCNLLSFNLFNQFLNLYYMISFIFIFSP